MLTRGEGRIYRQVNPEQCLISFFFHDSELGNEFASRPSPSRRPVIRGD